jgi:hypothetical protein
LDENSVVEELALYDVETTADANGMERIWMKRLRANLNMDRTKNVTKRLQRLETSTRIYKDEYQMITNIPLHAQKVWEGRSQTVGGEVS